MILNKYKHKVILLIMDGWGVGEPGEGNCISQAKTQNFNSLIKSYPHTENKASGNAVGLPEGSQGNSEVGHLHIGAGRIVWQMLERINNEIKDKSFFNNEVLNKVIEHVKNNGSSLHLMGLCSDEGVHAHTAHLIALLRLAKANGLNGVYIHFFADGRDVAERSARKYVDIIEDECKKGVGQIASVVGRYYAMDRDNNWGRTQQAYELLTSGKGFKAKNATEAIEMAYDRGDKTDYYIQPTIIVDKDDKPLAIVKDNDAVIFFNFRTDRPRQLTKAFVYKRFPEFKREKYPGTYFITFTRYDKKIKCPFVFTEPKIRNNLAEIISRKGLFQLRIAETEKYAHVTYFFNSQVEKPYKNEDRILIPSYKVPSYDLKPEMSAYEIIGVAIKQLNQNKYDFIVINLANCDLVGHSAIKGAIIKAVEVVDECIGNIVNSALANNYVCIITADHGSAEDKLYPNGSPKPAHSTNPVNFIIASNDERMKNLKLKRGGQSDVAPTILEIMGIKKPKRMTGESLINWIA